MGGSLFGSTFALVSSLYIVLFPVYLTWGSGDGVVRRAVGTASGSTSCARSLVRSAVYLLQTYSFHCNNLTLHLRPRSSLLRELPPVTPARHQIPHRIDALAPNRLLLPLELLQMQQDTPRSSRQQSLRNRSSINRLRNAASTESARSFPVPARNAPPSRQLPLRLPQPLYHLSLPLHPMPHILPQLLHSPLHDRSMPRVDRDFSFAVGF